MKDLSKTKWETKDGQVLEVKDMSDELGLTGNN